MAGVDVNHLNEQAPRIGDETGSQYQQWNEENGRRRNQEHNGSLQRSAPAVQAYCRPSPPEPAFFPRFWTGINRGEERSGDADAAAAHHIQLDARLVKRA